MVMTVDEIADRVVSTLQEPSLVESDVIVSFNNCINDIASTIVIKDLATVATVTVPADNDSVGMPGDYHCNLSYVKYPNDGLSHYILLYDSKRILDKALGRLVGDRGTIYHAALDGTSLYVQYVPSSDTDLEVYYHRVPDDIVSGGEFPNYIPSGYLYGLFHSYSCAEIWADKEDGIEGEMVNTNYYNSKYASYLLKLKLFVGPDPDEPYTAKSFNRSFNFNG